MKPQPIWLGVTALCILIPATAISAWSGWGLSYYPIREYLGGRGFFDLPSIMPGALMALLGWIGILVQWILLARFFKSGGAPVKKPIYWVGLAATAISSCWLIYSLEETDPGNLLILALPLVSASVMAVVLLVTARSETYFQGRS